MRKVAMGMSLVVLVSMATGVLCAKVLSIDSGRILRESREGRNILALNDKDKKKVMDFEYEQSKKIGELRDKLEKDMRAGKLTEEAMQKSYGAIGKTQKMVQFEIGMARDDYTNTEKERVLAFRKKVHQVASEFFKKSGDVTNVFDKNTPGMIYVADSSDKTDDLLKELNVRHKKEKATLMLTKGSPTKKGKNTT